MLSLVRSEVRRTRYDARDLTSASRIQRSFLPTLAPFANGFRISTEYRPAKQVGGDFYDAIAPAPGQMMVVIGDVSGKGVSGALVMSRLVGEVHHLVAALTSPRELLQQLNRAFMLLGFDDMFATCACVTLDVCRHCVTVANAGHQAPLLRRRSGEVVALGDASGAPLGVFGEEQYAEQRFELEVGDILLLMTDGITEGLHRDDDVLGAARLTEVIAESPCNGCEINRRILAALDRSAPERLLQDDVTLLSLEATDEFAG